MASWTWGRQWVRSLTFAFPWVFTRVGSFNYPKPEGWALLLSFLFVGGETRAQRGEVTNSGSHSSQWQETGPLPAVPCVTEGQRKAWHFTMDLQPPLRGLHLSLPFQIRRLACLLFSSLMSRLFPYVEPAGLGGAEVRPASGSRQPRGASPSCSPSPQLLPGSNETAARLPQVLSAQNTRASSISPGPWRRLGVWAPAGGTGLASFFRPWVKSH